MPLAALGAALAGCATVGWLAHRERARLRERRATLLDSCGSILASFARGVAPDGFARATGTYRGHAVALVLTPDSLTARRLPQLWLSVTVKDAPPIEADFAVLVRVNGAEFFASTHRLPERLEAPASWPAESLVRGSGPAAARIVTEASAPVGRLLADPKTKEVAVTRRGYRTSYQISEGGRGDYLLLRQSAFGIDQVDPRVVRTLLDGLLAIGRAFEDNDEAQQSPQRMPEFVA